MQLKSSLYYGKGSQEPKSLCGELRRPYGARILHPPDPALRLGCTLGYSESPLRGWILAVYATVVPGNLVLTQLASWIFEQEKRPPV